MFFVIAWMGRKCQRKCVSNTEINFVFREYLNCFFFSIRARPHQPTPPWRGPRKRVANSQRSFERAMEADAGTPEGRWRKGADGRISQRVKW